MQQNELLTHGENRTRVVLLGGPQEITFLVKEALEMERPGQSYWTEKHTILGEGEFLIVQTLDPVLAQSLRPNILFLLQPLSLEQFSAVLEQVTDGGIVVYDKDLNDVVLALGQGTNFYRHIPFDRMAQPVENYSTPIGMVPISESLAPVVPYLQGIEELLRHLGIQSEAFAEVLSMQ